MTVVRTGRACAALVAALVLASACDASTDLQPCNIAIESCQEDIYYALIRLRGDGYDPLAGVPPIKTIPLEEYRRQLQEAADKRKAAMEAAAGDDEDDEEDPEAPKPVVPW